MNALFTLALLILVFMSKRKDYSSSLSLTIFYLCQRQTTLCLYVSLLSAFIDALIHLLNYGYAWTVDFFVMMTHTDA